MTNEITPERIAELRAAHEATSFPWHAEGCCVFLDAAYIYSHGPVLVCSASGANIAKTIAAARNALPDLIREIERRPGQSDPHNIGIMREADREIRYLRMTIEKLRAIEKQVARYIYARDYAAQEAGGVFRELRKMLEEKP